MHLLVFLKRPFEAMLAQCQVIGLFCQAVHMGTVGPIPGTKEFMLKCHFINAMLMLCLLYSFMVDNGVKEDNCVSCEEMHVLTSHWVMQQKASSAVLGPYF